MGARSFDRDTARRLYNEESDRDMRVKATQTVRDVLDGLPVRNQVNL